MPRLVTRRRGFNHCNMMSLQKLLNGSSKIILNVGFLYDGARIPGPIFLGAASHTVFHFCFYVIVQERAAF